MQDVPRADPDPPRGRSVPPYSVLRPVWYSPVGRERKEQACGRKSRWNQLYSTHRRIGIGDHLVEIPLTNARWSIHCQSVRAVRHNNDGIGPNSTHLQRALVRQGDDSLSGVRE